MSLRASSVASRAGSWHRLTPSIPDRSQQSTLPAQHERLRLMQPKCPPLLKPDQLMQPERPMQPDHAQQMHLPLQALVGRELISFDEAQLAYLYRIQMPTLASGQIRRQPSWSRS